MATIIVKSITRDNLEMWAGAITCDGVHAVWSTLRWSENAANREAQAELARLMRVIEEDEASQEKSA